MDEFVSAVAERRDVVLDRPPSANAAKDAYMRADARLYEAETVAPCVARFVTAEVRPPRNTKPVGRFSGASVTPPIGKYLGSRLGAHETEVRCLVTKAVAVGYFAMITLEGQTPSLEAWVVPDRDAETIWPYWVTNVGTGQMVRNALPPDDVDMIGRMCHEDFSRGLRELGLGRWRLGGTRFVGALYGEAGLLLRALQTRNFQPDSRSDVLAATNLWPFEDMPVE